MAAPAEFPKATQPIDGVVHRKSRRTVDATVEALSAAVLAADATVFFVLDQAEAARRVGLSLRATKLVVFGSPAAGTPLMQQLPPVALDLPLKVLVWADDDDVVWMSYLSADWLAGRYGLSPEQTKVLAATEVLTGRVAGSD